MDLATLFPMSFTRCYIALFASMLCSARGALAQAAAVSPPPASPSSHGVDTLLAKFDQRGAPGVCVAVIREGKIEYRRAIGMADLEHAFRLRTDAAFDIASMSKQLTAMCVVRLEEDGLLSLGDALQNIIYPNEFQFHTNLAPGPHVRTSHDREISSPRRFSGEGSN